MADRNYLQTKVRPAVKYYGGKSGLARRINNLMTDHRTYLEPFAGGLNVLLNKYRSTREIACDLDEDLIHFYHYLVDHTDQVCSVVRRTPYTRETFLAARDSEGETDPLARAVNFLVKYRMSWGGIGGNFSTTDDHPDEISSGWSNLPDDLARTAGRLRGVEIRLQSVFEAIEEFDNLDTLSYIDPPYYSDSRISPKVYKHEFTAFQHLQLLRRIKRFRGQVILSGYSCLLYDEELAGWGRYEHIAAKQSSPQKVRPQHVEVLWVKPSDRTF